MGGGVASQPRTLEVQARRSVLVACGLESLRAHLDNCKRVPISIASV